MRRSLLPLVVLTLLTACSSGDSADPAASSSALGVVQPPAGYSSHTLGPLSFSTPQGWQPVDQQPGTTAAGTMQLALRAPDPGGGPAPVALALLTSSPRRAADQEVEALTAIKRDVHKAQDISERPVSLEGFTNATLVSFTEAQATGGPQRTEVLIGDLEDGSLITLTVIASPATFTQGGLGAIALSAKAAARST